MYHGCRPITPSQSESDGPGGKRQPFKYSRLQVTWKSLQGLFYF